MSAPENVVVSLTLDQARELLSCADDGSAHLTADRSATVRAAMSRLQEAIEDVERVSTPTAPDRPPQILLVDGPFSGAHIDGFMPYAPVVLLHAPSIPDDQVARYRLVRDPLAYVFDSMDSRWRGSP